MTIIDEFKSEKNRNIIIHASNKMLLDKYKLTLKPDILINIINMIISSMSKDAILMNNTVKLMELNTITLAKMKNYITKNIDNINADGQIYANTIDNNVNNITNILLNEEITVVNTPDFINEDYNKPNILTNEELLIRVKEYEHKREISNTIYANIENNIDISPLSVNTTNTTNTTNTNTNTTKIISEIMEKVLISLNTNTNTNTNKKTLIVNSFSRDWINNPNRNKLSFTVNIDLVNNIIEPLKILFPKYVKELTPYIILVITDNHKTFKFTFLYSKSLGKWDIWKLINKGDNINNNINLTNKNWRIKFLDYLNNELNLGKDNIKISNINDYKMNTYNNNNNNNINTNIDNLLIPYNDDINNLSKDLKYIDKLNLYELNIEYLNKLEYDDFHLNIISKYDYIQIKTNKNEYVNIKVVDINNDIGKIVILNETNLMADVFNNSSLLNYGAQYSIILTYYPKRTVT
jgi:hypothetical protein